MRTLIQATMDRLPGPWDTVLVLGAGAGSSLPLLRQLAPRRMLLAEPQPDQARLLERAVEPGRGEAALPLAVAGTEAGEAVLHLCNASRFNSLSRPTGLAQVLPNLREAGELRVPASPLRVVAASNGLDASGRNLLVVESVGQLSGVLADSAALSIFSALIVKAGEEPLFADDPGLPELRTVLTEAGFDCGGADPEAIYPIAVELFLRNDARAQAKAFQVEARHAAAECERLETERAVQQRLAEQRAAELERLRQEIAGLQAALAEARQQAEQAIGRLREETGTLKAALDKSQVELATARSEHETRRAAVAKERDEQSRLAAQYKVELDKVNKQNQERGARIAQLEREHAELGERQAMLDQEMIRAEAQIDLIKDVLLRDAAL